MSFHTPDLTKFPPRSPRVRLGGYVILPRMLDKGRATLAGKHGEYHYACPMDQRFLEFVGIDPEALKKELAKSDSGNSRMDQRERETQTHARRKFRRGRHWQEQRAPDNTEWPRIFQRHPQGRRAQPRGHRDLVRRAGHGRFRELRRQGLTKYHWGIGRSHDRTRTRCCNRGTPGDNFPDSPELATRRASYLAVQLDVNKLCSDESVHNRDHRSQSEQQCLENPACGGLGKPLPTQAANFLWHHAGCGWGVKFNPYPLPQSVSKVRSDPL